MLLGQTPRESFRTSEIIAQNTAPPAAAATKLPRLLLAGVGLFLVYKLFLKGSK